MEKRYEGRLLDAIPRAKNGTLFGWVDSPEYRDDKSVRIICKFDEVDIESGKELIRKVDLYGGWNGEHSDTCPSRGVRCEHGEICGGFPRLFVSFTVEKMQHKCVAKLKQTEIRALTNKDGSPKLDAETGLASFEHVPILNEHGQPVWEWQETGEEIQVHVARGLRFSFSRAV